MIGTIVLIHGAWQGSWAFEAWRPLLAARGWRSVAVDLPGNGWNPQPLTGNGLDCQAAHVARVLADQPGPCVVLGHSGGGLAASQGAPQIGKYGPATAICHRNPVVWTVPKQPERLKGQSGTG